MLPTRTPPRCSFPSIHARLVLGLKGYAEDAGIQAHWVWTPLADHVGEIECSYLKKFPILRAEGQVNGLVLTRKTVEADPFEHMSALTGAFVRNFIRARLMTLQSVLQQLKDGDHIEATVLLIPNFFHSKEEGGSILQWQATRSTTCSCSAPPRVCIPCSTPPASWRWALSTAPHSPVS